MNNFLFEHVMLGSEARKQIGSCLTMTRILRSGLEWVHALREVFGLDMQDHVLIVIKGCAPSLDGWAVSSALLVPMLAIVSLLRLAAHFV